MNENFLDMKNECFTHLQNNYITSVPSEMTTMSTLTTVNMENNYIDCEHVKKYISVATCTTSLCLSTNIYNKNNSTLFCSTACTSDKCDASVPVCGVEGGECRIQCGSETYRDGDYCYRCDDDEGLCAECDGEGLCAVCRAGVDKIGDDCENRQQQALDALAAQLANNGKTGCRAPDVLRCGTSCSGSDECGAFSVSVDSTTKRITKLFDDDNSIFQL